ncbi:hypothetical protein B0I35DRAFT_478740 [Stachybotrys elegans]|uniref:DUF6546 domain-containing protein n=1 Tax=Stachybotrys elegans TaxID=80388 RepID=A0A8K0SR39_9HYPO|nr:hypothetical protein B0I35DRAFT_478740 [Stachybotrys elegans]
MSCIWSTLPAEIRLLILENVINSYEDEENKQNSHPLSKLAVVSNEWQYQIEKHLFKRLIINQHDIDAFHCIFTDHRRKFPQWVWLRYELPTYGCDVCNLPETPADIEANNASFGRSVEKLFCSLASWTSTAPSVPKGRLTLELSVHSPSDKKHFCRELESREYDTAWSYSDPLPVLPLSDRKHGFVRGYRVRELSCTARARVYGRPRGMSLSHAATVLRPVPSVGRLVIRRQFYRHFSVSKCLGPILGALPALTDFNYEHWRGSMALIDRNIRHQQHRILFGDVLSKHPTLKRVSVFEDFQPTYHTHLDSPAQKQLGQKLARSSRHLEELHAALNVDARDFFHNFYPGSNADIADGLRWGNLRLLSLTSRYLAPESYQSLIKAAAAAAQNMLKLQTMELWNGHRRGSCIFRYKVVGGQPEIQLLSTWDAEFDHTMTRCWEAVAQLNCPGRQLISSVGRLDPRYVVGHSTILRFLELIDRMLNATSLNQILAPTRVVAPKL